MYFFQIFFYLKLFGLGFELDPHVFIGQQTTTTASSLDIEKKKNNVESELPKKFANLLLFFLQNYIPILR